MKIYHVSEDPSIERFDPRMDHAFPERGPLVFAITESHLHLYLVPRDCPRVTFYAAETTLDLDVQKFLNGDRDGKVVAIERGWHERAQSTRLYLYEFAMSGFECIDEGAGIFVSEKTVIPIAKTAADSPLQELACREVDVRLLDTLWPLHDAVADSSLQFSMIRMRNASPREQHVPTDPI